FQSLADVQVPRLRDGSESFKECSLFVRKVRFRYLRLPFALSQIVIALIDRDSIQPGFKRSLNSELRQGKVDLGEHFLGNVLNFTWLPHHLVHEAENTALVFLDKEFERSLVPLLTPLDQFLINCHGARPSDLEHRDVSHASINACLQPMVTWNFGDRRRFRTASP